MKGIDKKIGDLRVWWIPQIPGKAFEVDVESPQEAMKILEVLGQYDDFQYKNLIKPDYANAGGLNVCTLDEETGKLTWESWCDPETGEDIDEVMLRLEEESEETDLLDEPLEQDSSPAAPGAPGP